MKRISIFFNVAILIFFTIPKLSNAQINLSVNLCYSYNNISTGDINKIIDFRNGYYDTFKNNENIESFSGKIDRINWAHGYGMELIMHLKNQMRIGLQAEFYKSSQTSTISGSEIPTNLYHSYEDYACQNLTIIPLKLKVYYTNTLTPKMNLTFSGGPGFYSSTFKSLTIFRKIEHFTVGAATFEEGIAQFQELEASDTGLGVNVGLGLEFNLFSRLKIYFASNYTYCKLRDWNGDESYLSVWEGNSNSGTLWYIESSEDGETWFPQFAISKEKPTAGRGNPYNASIKNVRKARVDLSGFSFKIGVNILLF